MSKEDLSADTEVVLLLCGRFGGEKQEAYQPLAPREYGELAKWLKALALRPSDLLTDAGRAALSSSIHEARLERQRVEFLLGRGTAMALALERWARGGLWVISRGDEAYPQRLKRRLKNAAPPLLYGAGDKALLDKGGLAIIGSRAASESALSFTRGLGARCANEGLAVVSGGARGVDAAAMQGATEAGGYCIGVLPSDLLKTSVNRQNRIGLQEGRLVLVSPFYPEAGFNAGNAMGRNRYIYTLADHALVINSALRSGGTWQGAIENLKHGWVPLYVRTPGEGDGNAALVAEGALPFALTPDSPDTLIGLFGAQAVSQPLSGDETADAQQSLLAPGAGALAEAAPSESPPVSAQEELPPQPGPEALAVHPTAATDLLAGSFVEDPSRTTGPTIDESAAAEEPVPVGSGGIALDMYADFSDKLESLLGGEALSEEEVATQLCLEKSQAKAWLKRAIGDGLVEKLKKPVRYALSRQSSQSSLC
ncbi:MAG: DNA-processing protein DprA [Burkholderiales bacterium]|nr:DNA-processing protein DprA [Burkholderiales bacterium]